MTERMRPFISDRDTGGFFAAAAEGRLVIRTCGDCGKGIHPPTARCPRCGSWNTDWKQSEGRGFLHSWTTVMHQVHPAYPVPYTIVVVTVADARDVRLVGKIDGQPELGEGDRMEVWFEPIEGGGALPQWRKMKE